MQSLHASGHDTGRFLITQLIDELLDICGEENRIKLEARLSAVLSLYEIRPRQPAAGHPDVIEKSKQFLAAKKLEGCSPITIETYRLNLNIFAENVVAPVGEITTADIRLYLADYEHLKPASISTKLSILKSFFGWLTGEEIITRDPTRKIKPPKKEQRLPKALSIAELEMLREHCETLRERAFLEIFYATGGRLAEVHGLDKKDVDWQDGSARVVGKGDKEREVYLSIRADYHLKKYLKSREDDCPALFVTERRPCRRLSMRGIQREIKAIAARAGMGDKVHPHVLRHTFATLTLNNGAELAVLQQLLGHESPVTTQIYAQVTDERKKQAHKKYLIQ